MKIRSLMQEQDVKPLPVPDASAMIPRVHGRILNSKRFNAEMEKFREIQGIGIDQPTGATPKKKLNPTPNDAAKKAHEYYLNKGVPAHVSAGIVANFFWESGMNPNAEEQANTAEGRGYAQWNKNDRWLEYKNWAKTNGRNFKDGNTQLDYALVEAKQRGNYDKLLGTSTPEQAALVWSNDFEVPNPELAHNDMRQATSRILYDEKKPKILAYGGHIRKPTYATGGAIPFNSIGQIGGGLIDTFNKNDSVTGNVFSGILSGGGTGASIGSALGPIGTGVGAIVGAAIGGISKGIGAKKRHEEEAYAKMLAQQGYTNSELIRSQGVMATQPENYGGYSFYGDGGVIPRDNTQVQRRGYVMGGNNRYGKGYKIIRDTIQEQKEGENIANNMALVSDGLGYIPHPLAQVASYVIGFPGSYRALRNPKDNIDKLSGAVGLVPAPRIINSAVNTFQAINDVRLDNRKKLFAEGGEVQEPYEAEKGEVIQGDAQLEAGTQHASDMHEVGGNTHEQGGTMGVGGNIVFSDRIVVGDQLAEAITKMGISTDRKDTYAEVALKLAKLKGKSEERVKTTDRIKGTTATANIAKISQLTEILFAMQEQYKQNGTFAYGGHIRRGMIQMKRGGNIPYQQALSDIMGMAQDGWLTKNPQGQSIDFNTLDSNGMNQEEMWGRQDPSVVNPTTGLRNPISLGTPFNGNVSTMPNYSNTINSKIGFDPTNRSNIPINRTGNVPYSSANSIATPMTVSPQVSTTQAVGQNGQGIDWQGALGQVTPYVSSVVGYLRNRNSIKRMNTNPNVNLLTNPAYTYNDRSYDAINDVDNQMRNIQKSIIQNGGSSSAQAALFAKGLEAKNKIRYGETMRRDTYNSGFSNQVNAVNQANVGLVNNRNELSRNDKNQQQALLMQADNSLLENLNTVTAENNQKQSDIMRMMYLQKMYNVGRGTGDYDEQERNKRIANGTRSFLDRYENKIFNRRSIFNSNN